MDGSQAIISNAVWLALFPLTYIIHFAEEFWGGEGYPAYLYRLRGVSMTTRRFVVLQTLGFIFFLVASFVSYSFGLPQLMIAILSGFFFCNGLSHTVTAIFDRRYGPGLFASVLLWMPLGAVSIYFLIGQMTNLRLFIGVAAGFAINGLVAVATLRGGRLG
jgi:hypothetical protein